MSTPSGTTDKVSRKRVLIVVNKWWECDPVMGVLLHDIARPAAELGWPSFLSHPRRRPDQKNLPAKNPWPVPRAVFTLSNITAEVWCISDLLEHLLDETKFQSSSERKGERLPLIFAGQGTDFLVAVGTAGFPSEETQNGSVVIGTKIFMHNAHPKGKNPDSNWSVGPFDKVIPSKLDQAGFKAITNIEPPSKPSVADRFLVTPLNPTAHAQVLTDYDYVDLGAVNATNYLEYAATDTATLEAYKKKYDPTKAMSLETTHGVIRAQSDAPFLFVSGITDRVGYFATEVQPREYAQNTTAAHNMGVVVAWLIPQINKFFEPK